MGRDTGHLGSVPLLDWVHALDHMTNGLPENNLMPNIHKVVWFLPHRGLALEGHHKSKGISFRCLTGYTQQTWIRNGQNSDWPGTGETA